MRLLLGELRALKSQTVDKDGDNRFEGLGNLAGCDSMRLNVMFCRPR